MAFEKPVVVLDNGSYNIKAGFACDNHPVSIFRSIVGRPNYLRGSYGNEYYDVFIGDDAMEKIEDLELNHPVVNGKIVHWDNMERIWHHVFYRELKAAPEDRAVIMSCSNTAPMDEKIKSCEIFFETLNCPALCIQAQGTLAVYGSGLTTGLCIDMGYDTVDIIPVFEGGLIKYAHIQTQLAGAQISDYIKHSFNERSLGGTLKSPKDLDTIVKQCVYITKDIAMSKENYTKNCTLSNGEVVDVFNEAFMAGELLFQPGLIMGKETNYTALPKGVVQSISKCDSELQTALYEAIIPCGGLSTLPGLNERLELEIEDEIHRPVKVIFSPESYTVIWLGAATFAGLPDAKNVWVTQKQYEDYGVRIIKNKFM
ncbi:uncharacterized protein LOC126979069 [Leptidea sinapis]|uniref:uncharacterized protein LOC126979069 n=1 Tax=Leptidea sinapis TaxID=189913 RepID=UPI00212ADD8B|nr:uncharacterized protein LOC126979069 [Leptidea sinapis]